MNLFGLFAKAWTALKDSEPPDCPQCRGTGLSGKDDFSEWIYWKGNLIEVCATCEGSGKV